MMIRFVLLFLLAAVFAPFSAKASTLAQMRSTCQIGTDPQPSGSMPLSEPGVVVISAAEAKCVLDRFKDVVLIAPMADKQQIPGANPIMSLARAPGDAEARAKYTPYVKQLTGGDLSRPVMVYCHHSSCGYSHNAAINLRNLGYRNILWLRPGLKGWAEEKYALAASRDIRLPLDIPEFVRLYAESEEETYGCFGEKKADACDKKYDLLKQALAAPGVSRPTRKSSMASCSTPVRCALKISAKPEIQGLRTRRSSRFTRSWSSVPPRPAWER